MTECERIIEQGILPKSFFEPETICDFYVDEKRKKIWAVELDLLLEFDRVCKKHGLSYFLMFGSLLGAIRHKGFIPWDDDIDVVMFRNDYEKLMMLSAEFQNPYFLQTPYTDKGYYYSYIKIRNSNTTAISKKFRFNEYNHGMFLDIFPLDLVNENYTIEKYNEIKTLILENSTYMKKSNPYLNEVDKQRVALHKGLDPLKVFEKMNALATSFSKEGNCTKYATVLTTMESYGNNMYNIDDFKSIYCNLYNWLFPIPSGYLDILKHNFGNWNEFPPMELRMSCHSGLIIDPDIPYVEMLVRKTEG